MELTAKEIQKYKKRSHDWLIAKAQERFNEYIRLRDKDNGCISCLKGRVENAGHYMSAGHHTALRYNEDNVHGQCIQCNMYLSANLINYRKNLVRKIGVQKVEMLEGVKRAAHNWDRLELITIIKIYSQKVKELK